MNIIQELLQGTVLPRMVKVRQRFNVTEISDVQATLQAEFRNPDVGDTIKPGMRIAVAVGSRGLNQLPLLVKTTVEEIKARGGIPFIVPAMGSHGAATAEGQVTLLAELGVTEDSAGCEIISSMEVVKVGQIDSGLEVLMDKTAYEADGIVIINRIKPHTAFRGPCESGFAKMITIGLANQKGADACHAYGFGKMAEHVLEMAKIKIAATKILFGIATIENAYDNIYKLVAVPAAVMLETEQKLLPEAKQQMPRIMFDPIDVLVVDQIGKEISGEGMDPNITGRYATPYASGGISVNKVVIRDLTDKSHGNATGVGVADYITRKMFDKFDLHSLYSNCLTNTITRPALIPPIMDNDKEALLSAVKTCNARDLSWVKMVRIKDTMHLEEIYISEALLAEAQNNPDIEICGEPVEMRFDDAGNLID